MKIKIPKMSMVVLIGPSGAGKSTFAATHFLPTEVLASDACRGWVSDDPNDQSASHDAFEVLNFIAAKRLAAGRLTVIDATNVQPESRRSLVQLARKFQVLPVAIVLNMPDSVCSTRNAGRPDRNFAPHVTRRQRSQLRRSMRGLKREGFRNITILDSPEAVDAVTIERVPLWNDRRDLTGPFDIIGDVHGCADELESLLVKLGYQRRPSDAEVSNGGWSSLNYAHPDGRIAFFVGDLVDRGPKSVDVVSIVRNMVAGGSGMCVPGNHDVKLVRKLRGKNVKIRHGLAETLADIERIDASVRTRFESELATFLDRLVSHYVVDGGKLVVAHAGLKEEFQGRGSGKVREFALYGETTGEIDKFGLPVRMNWAENYRGDAMVVFGHTPVPDPMWLNNTVNIDTGCCFGGRLTALRYPEMETVSVAALQTYCEPVRPIESVVDGADSILDARDVLGKRIVSTRLRSNITIREDNATAALETISRFAVDPRWLIYLPPTMSPSETSTEPGYLEHPHEAFAYFSSQGVGEVICQEKHMGSRAVVVLAKDAAAARNRFGTDSNDTGAIVTRTGRPFFKNDTVREQVLQRLRASLDQCEFWKRFDTTWVCLDCELMPWSAKARDLLQTQYAAVGAAGRSALPPTLASLTRTRDRFAERGVVSDELDALVDATTSTESNVQRFIEAYRGYCWNVDGVDDYRLAAFHVLATERKVHVDRDHRWHLKQISRFAESGDALFQTTQFCEVDVNDASSVADGTRWWLDLTEAGGEGMVVKPIDFLAYAKKGLIQPAIKCRGKEYLRIIYGPNYDEPSNLDRLRNRSVGRKRSLALRELALGIESLERFVNKRPLRSVHECVFGVLALESEPVDPRL